MPLAPRIAHAKTGGEQEACQHELALKRLEPDLDTMRQLITCKICQRFLSEPYGLACGHTYCYVCLDAWLVAQKKRTCPDCRATIKEQPVPSYLIREMTRVFAYRQELLPAGETVEEHDEYIKEAVLQVATDKETEGLFSGLFKGGRMHWMPLHDPGDDVDRCPNCHWEMEEGRCGSCGLTIGDEDGFGLDTEESDNSEDEDDELDNDLVPHDYDGIDDPGSFDEDDYLDEDGHHRFADEQEGSVDLDIFGPMPPPAGARRRARQHRDRINLDSEPESEDSEDPDNDPLMEGFLDNEAIEESGSDSSREQSDSEEEAEETPRHRHRQIIRPTVIHDSDSDDVPRQPRRPVTVEDSSDEEGPVSRNNQRACKVSRGTRRAPVVQTISSDEDTSPDNSDDENSDSASNSESDDGGVNAGAFSPVQSPAGRAISANDDLNLGPYDNDATVHRDEEPGYSDYESPGDVDDDDDDIDNGGYGNDYGNDYGSDFSDGEDDGVRSTTAGSAPFPPLATFHKLTLTSQQQILGLTPSPPPSQTRPQSPHQRTASAKDKDADAARSTAISAQTPQRSLIITLYDSRKLPHYLKFTASRNANRGLGCGGSRAEIA